MKKLAVAFSGKSNSGKTTLIVKISDELHKRGFKVCITKHDPKDKAVFDTVRKDSYKFAQTKADVVVVSPKKTTLLKQYTSSIDDIVKLFGEFDYMLVEGLKTLPLPRITVFRDDIDDEYLQVSDAIAVTNNVAVNNISKQVDILDLDNIDKIIDWIEKNAKRY